MRGEGPLRIARSTSGETQARCLTTAQATSCAPHLLARTLPGDDAPMGLPAELTPPSMPPTPLRDRGDRKASPSTRLANRACARRTPFPASRGAWRTPFQLAVSRDLHDLPLRCVPDVLRDAGFATELRYGSNGSFEHLGDFAARHGFHVTDDANMLPEDVSTATQTSLGNAIAAHAPVPLPPEDCRRLVAMATRMTHLQLSCKSWKRSQPRTLNSQPVTTVLHKCGGSTRRRAFSWSAATPWINCSMSAKEAFPFRFGPIRLALYLMMWATRWERFCARARYVHPRENEGGESPGAAPRLGDDASIARARAIGHTD